MNFNFNQQTNSQGFGDLNYSSASFYDHQTQFSSNSSNNSFQQSSNQQYGSQSNCQRDNYPSSFSLNSPSSSISPPNFDSYGQNFDFRNSSPFNNRMDEHSIFNRSSSSMTPRTSPFDRQQDDYFDQADGIDDFEGDDQQETDFVPNYGPKNSEIYREKRNRNNEAVRKARKKAQKKTHEVQQRLVVLREENERLMQQRTIVQRVHDELLDLNNRMNY